ncbi:anti-sigma factor family protein [Actinomadura rudentiformis]|uniref:Zf-HC2 domain-containing protein n=1 Tax=Actinomadura rudentiformis TaxID=359158 RepID=A0A6H9YGY8_9ACTN|nr:zf-HC2 domain-containing protein [Actinomadura rudentiformis]KAB2341361.1 zf-HC2 domain-containing protein [Actinomadura rudentiformis]
MSCLGERLTALVDGELGHEERDRALAHLARCERCRTEADALRRLKGRLRGLADLPLIDGDEPLPSGDLMSRLRAMGAGTGTGPGTGPGEGAPGEGVPGVNAPGEGVVPPTGRPSPVRSPLLRHGGPRERSPLASRPRDNRPAGRAAVSRSAGRGAGLGAGGVLAHRAPRRRYLAVGAATLFLGLGTASYVAGGEREAPTVTPAFDRFAVEHALTSGDVPLTDPVNEDIPVQVSPEP